MTPSLPRSSHDTADEPLDLTDQVGPAPAEVQRPEPVWVDVPEQQPEAGADGRKVLGWALAVLALPTLLVA